VPALVIATSSQPWLPCSSAPASGGGLRGILLRHGRFFIAPVPSSSPDSSARHPATAAVRGRQAAQDCTTSRFCRRPSGQPGALLIRNTHLSPRWVGSGTGALHTRAAETSSTAATTPHERRALVITVPPLCAESSFRQRKRCRPARQAFPGAGGVVVVLAWEMAASECRTSCRATASYTVSKRPRPRSNWPKRWRRDAALKKSAKDMRDIAGASKG
jgi:hypothetical protein